MPNGDFEVHCYACGPTGSNVYYFKNNNGGLLSGLKEEVMVVWEKNIIYILMKNKNGWVKNNLLQWSKGNRITL